MVYSNCHDILSLEAANFVLKKNKIPTKTCLFVLIYR